jgi:hypothetical protein
MNYQQREIPMPRSKALLTQEQFDAAIRQGGVMKDHNIELARQILVLGVPNNAAAKAADVLPSQASTIVKRVLQYHQTALTLKKTAAQFMAEKPPREQVIEALRPELLKLHKAKYTVEQLIEFLAANDVHANRKEVLAIIEGSNP